MTPATSDIRAQSITASDIRAQSITADMINVPHWGAKEEPLVERRDEKQESLGGDRTSWYCSRMPEPQPLPEIGVGPVSEVFGRIHANRQDGP